MKFWIGLVVMVAGLFVGGWLIFVPLEPMHWWVWPRIISGALIGLALVLTGWALGNEGR